MNTHRKLLVKNGGAYPAPQQGTRSPAWSGQPTSGGQPRQAGSSPFPFRELIAYNKWVFMYRFYDFFK